MRGCDYSELNVLWKLSYALEITMAMVAKDIISYCSCCPTLYSFPNILFELLINIGQMSANAEILKFEILKTNLTII